MADVPFVGEVDFGLISVLLWRDLVISVLEVKSLEAPETVERFVSPYLFVTDGTGGTGGCLEGDRGLRLSATLLRETLREEAGRDGSRIGLSVL